MNTNWFNKWFNSSYYDLLYSNRDETEAEAFIRAILNSIELPEESNILDMACGTGRHSAVMDKLGHYVTGIDLSRRKILEANSRTLDRSEFLIHDMRIPFRINYFRLALNIFTSMGYSGINKDNQLVMNAAASGLIKGGTMVVDFLNPLYVTKNLVEKETIERGNVIFNLTRSIENDSVRKDIKITDGDISKGFVERVQLISKDNFLEYFEQAGLKVNAIYGDYQLNTFVADTSERMIFVTTKV